MKNVGKGVSPIIGVIFMVVITVIITAVIATFIVGLVGTTEPTQREAGIVSYIYSSEKIIKFPYHVVFFEGREGFPYKIDDTLYYKYNVDIGDYILFERDSYYQITSITEHFRSEMK